MKKTKEIDALYEVVGCKRNQCGISIGGPKYFFRSLSIYNKRVGEIYLSERYDGLMTYEEAVEALKSHPPIADYDEWVEKPKIIKFDLPYKGILRIRDQK